MNNDADTTNVYMYTQTKMPDYVYLSAILVAAKGPDRSMEQFALECDVSPATFSRIRNRKITRPLSVELIKCIAEHADTADGTYSSDYYLEQLLEANGMTKGDAAEEEVRRVIQAIEALQAKRKADLNKQVDLTVGILSSDLIYSGHTVRALCGDDLPEVINYITANTSAAIFELIGHTPKYCCCHMFTTLDYDPTTSIYDSIVKTGYLTGEDLDDMTIDLFGYDEYITKGLEDMMTVFVINDEELFYEFIELKQGTATNSQMAVMLVDFDERTVAKEWHFPMKSGEEYPPIIVGNTAIDPIV